MKPLADGGLSGQTRGGGAPRQARRSQRFEVYKSERIEIRSSQAERDAWILAASREGYLSLSDWIRDRLNGAARARVLLSSDHQAWNTPRVVLDAISPMGPIAVDPCSNGSSIVPALMRWTATDDGLSFSWADAARELGGIVYVNSPYGDALPLWIARCAEEARAGAEVIALCPARVDTRWWCDALASGAVAALWRGRVKYGGAKHAAPFPIALLYWGPRASMFREALRPFCASFAVDHRHEVTT